MRLGSSSIEISRVVLGCMWPERLDEAAIVRIIHAAYDAGITAFDTAPLYGFHGSEPILGRALRDRRDKVQILTKAGLCWDDAHGEALFEFHDANGMRRTVRKDSRPAQLVAEVEASLRRLDTDVIDLLQIHHPDALTPIEESLDALRGLVRAGKVRALGVSNFSPAQLTRAAESCSRADPRASTSAAIAALQCEYNLLERWPEAELIPLCQKHELALLAYSPLAKGVLASKRMRPARTPRASADTFYGHPLVRPLIEAAVRDALVPLAERHGVGAGEVALACLLAAPLQAVVVGASSEPQARDSARAQQLNLTPDELLRVRARFAALDTPLRAIRRTLKLPGIARVDRLARRLLHKLGR